MAIYPGAFDPVHLGHLDLATRAAALFDCLVVAVYDRPRKHLAFSGDQRSDFFRRGLATVANVEVVTYDGLTVDFARQRGAGYIVRGLRGVSDFEYEDQLNTMNRHLASDVETVFLMTSARYAFLSSSLIKEVAAEGAPLDGLVPDYVAEALATLYGRAR